MDVRAAEKIQLDNAAFQERESLPSDSQEKESRDTKPSLTLDQIFNQDILKELSTKAVSQAIEAEELTPSLWNKIISWWKEPEKTPSTQASSIDLKTAQEDAISERISHVPVIEAPDVIPPDLETAKLPPAAKKGNIKDKWLPSEIAEGLSHMSEQSIESIMFIIFKAQIELEKENANIAQGTFSKYLDFQKLQQKVLQEIKDVLVKDQNVAGYFQAAQNLAIAASFIAGIAAAAMTFGLLTPIGGFIEATLGANIRTLFMFAAEGMGSTGLVISSGLTGLTLATKAYFKKLSNTHRAEHEEYEHLERYYDDRADDSRNRLMTSAEADSVFKEYWIRLLKRSDKMRKIVLKK